MNRPLKEAEKNLIRWMLENGQQEARKFLTQLDKAQVTPWRCPCGCASLHLSIDGMPETTGGIHPLANFIFGSDQNLNGIFVFEQDGILSGLEVYGLPGEASKELPSPESLRPFANA